MLKKIGFFFFIILAMLYFTPNFFIYRYPFFRTAPLRCKVIDERTGSPLSNVKVKVSWSRLHILSLYATQTREDFSEFYTTDKKGEVFIPRKIVIDVFCGFPLFDNLRIYMEKNDYESRGFRVFSSKKYYNKYLSMFEKDHNRENVINLNDNHSILRSDVIYAVIKLKKN